MMQTVTEPGGTATQAAILGYHVAGKTGTARKVSGGGYSRRYMSFFAGLVPVDNPRFAMVVVINDPDAAGATTAAWCRRRCSSNVMDGALRLMDVPPDDIDTWLAAQAEAEAKRRKASGVPAAARRWCRRRRPRRSLPEPLPRRALAAGRRRGGCAMSRAMPLADLLPDVRRHRRATSRSRGLVHGQPRAASRAMPSSPSAGFGAHGLGFVDQARAAGAARDPVRAAGTGRAAPRRPMRSPCPACARAWARWPTASTAASTDAMTWSASPAPTARPRPCSCWRRPGRCAARAAGSIGTLGAGLYGRRRGRPGSPRRWCCSMHALLAQMRDAGAQAVAMEVSSHALDQGRVDGVHFDVAVFTNLTRDHLDYHGDMDSYGAAKARLFAWPGLRRRWSTWTMRSAAQLHASLPAGVRAIGLSSRGATGATRARRGDRARRPRHRLRPAHRRRQAHPVRSPLLGRFNVDNLLAVAGALHALG